MATATQQPPKQQATSLAKPADEGKVMSYVPFGAQDQIKLSVRIVQEMICVPASNGKICSEVEAFKFMMLCQARKLNPFEGDCFLLGYASDDGKSATFSLITAHQAFLKRAEMHPEFDGMESGVMVRDAGGNIVDREGDFVFDDDFILGGWAIVHFKTRKYPMRKRVKLLTFTTGKSRWKKDPCGMIVKVAEADALRSSFPTMLGGLYVEGEQPLQFVNETPKAPEIPAGRSKIPNGNGKSAAPAELPPEKLDGGEVQNDPPPPPPDFDEAVAKQWFMNLSDGVHQVVDMKAMYKLGSEIEDRRALLGEQYYGELTGLRQAKSAELLAAAKK